MERREVNMVPKVSVVIPGYNCVRTISETLTACLNQDYPENLREVIFVDDGSTDNTKDIVERFPVRYIWQKQAGPARARNRGWREAGGEIILFTDVDCRPDKDWIFSLVKNFGDPGIAAVGGSYGISNPQNFLASCIHAEIIWRHKMMPREVKTLGSYNLSIPRKILEELNGFDESYLTSSGEDNDLCYRLTKKGYRLVFEPKAIVYHRHPERLLPYLKHQFRHGFWRMRLYRQHLSMVKGDDYSSLLDYFPPLLALLIFFLTPFIFFPFLRRTLPLLMLVFLAIELLRTFMVFLYTKKIKHICLLGIIFLRDFFRGIGMFFGILKFFILEKMSTL